jgi:hypothetical protein
MQARCTPISNSKHPSQNMTGSNCAPDRHAYIPWIGLGKYLLLAPISVGAVFHHKPGHLTDTLAKGPAESQVKTGGKDGRQQDREEDRMQPHPLTKFLRRGGTSAWQPFLIVCLSALSRTSVP